MAVDAIAKRLEDIGETVSTRTVVVLSRRLT
jgi:hypothetical protein